MLSGRRSTSVEERNLCSVDGSVDIDWRPVDYVWTYLNTTNSWSFVPIPLGYFTGFIRDLEKLEKSWNLKIGQKVMEKIKENLEKSWNLEPGQKLKMFKLNIKFFPKKGLRCIPNHIPWRSAYCILYLNEGVILLIFKLTPPIIFCKTRGNFLEKSWNFIPGKAYKALFVFQCSCCCFAGIPPSEMYRESFAMLRYSVIMANFSTNQNSSTQLMTILCK
jgi:hypothetical protein